MWNMSHICKFLLLLFMFAILCTKIIPFLCWLLLYVAIVIWFQSLSPYNDAVVVTDDDDDDDDVRCMQYYAKRKKNAFLLQSKGIHITVISSTTTTTRGRESQNSISLIYWKIIRKSNIKFLIIDLKQQFRMWAELTHMMMMMMYCCVYCNFIYWSIKYLMALCKGNLKFQNRLLNRTFFFIITMML